MQKQEINVAILGFGLSGSTFHAPLILATKGLKLTHILSSQQARIKAIFPNVKVTQNLDQILTDNNINLIINTLPNQEHFNITRKCLEAGKHVVVEKPFVVNSEDGEKLIKLADHKNLLLSIYHNRRYDNGYLTLQKNINRLGKIYLYEAYFDRFRPIVNLQKWREQDGIGTGILYDLGSHLIDQAINLFGKPQKVSADLQMQRPNAQAVDYFHLTLFYNNLRVILGSSSIMASARPTLAAYGDQGSFVKFGLDPQEEALRSGLSPLDANYGKEPILNHGKLTRFTDNQLIEEELPSEKGNYLEYYQGIYQALSTNAPAPVTAYSGLAVIQVIEACIKSASLGSVIDL